MPTQPYHTKDGKRVPGVTTIIGKFKDADPLIYWAWDIGRKGKDFRTMRDKAADIGTIAHAMMEAHIRGKEFDGSAWPQELIERAKKPFGAFLEWAQGSKLVAEHSELPMVSEELRYGGCLDVTFIHGKRQLSDFKTGKDVYDEALIQVMGGYGLLWEENFPDKPLDGGYSILRFDKGGEFAHHWWPADHPKVKAARDSFKAFRIAYDARKILKGKTEDDD